ncbi:hypothetical protein K8R14_02865 [bacterium]|nr:hypothetical protein [bacterium]
MIENGKSEILRLPLPQEINNDLEDFSPVVSIALSQQFTPGYKDETDSDGWIIGHYTDKEDGYILIEQGIRDIDDPIFEIVIIRMADNQEIRELTTIISSERTLIGRYLFDLESNSIQSLDQTPNVEQP